MVRRRRLVARGRRRVRRHRISLAHLMKGVGRMMAAGRRRRHHRKRGGRRVHRRRQMAGSAFTDFFTKTIPGAAHSVYRHVLVPAHDFIKKHKLVSTGLSLIPHPAGKVAGVAARLAGYGRRRRRGGARKVVRMTGYGRRRMGGSALTGRLYFN